MVNQNKCSKTKSKPKPTCNLRTIHVCVSLCTTVIHNTALNSSDYFPPNLQTIMTIIYSTTSIHKRGTVKKRKISLEQSFTAHMPLLLVTNAFRLGTVYQSPSQWCYIYHLSTVG